MSFSSRIANASKTAYHLVDAKGQIVGRLACQLAPILQGKHKPTYVPHANCGDYLIVINAKDVVFTGKKWKQKLYQWHTGYPGGLKSRRADEQLERKPEEVLRKAIWGMLPKNNLRRQIYKKLIIFPGEEHTYQKELENKKSIV